MNIYYPFRVRRALRTDVNFFRITTRNDGRRERGKKVGFDHGGRSGQCLRDRRGVGMGTGRRKVMLRSSLSGMKPRCLPSSHNPRTPSLNGRDGHGVRLPSLAYFLF